MKLDRETISRLAAEYVLGTLRGPARRRFERMMSESREAANAVRLWRERWTTLYEEIPERQPAPQTWQGVERRLGWSQSPSSIARVWNSLPFWRGITAIAVLAVVFAGVLLRPAESPIEQATPSALILVLADEQQRAGWVMAASGDRLESQPLRALQRSADRDYELWLVPSDQAPLSLGLIDPVGSSAVELSYDLARRLHPGATLAVSLEPTGGSPTGQPTGPIVYTGQIIEL